MVGLIFALSLSFTNSTGEGLRYTESTITTMGIRYSINDNWMLSGNAITYGVATNARYYGAGATYKIGSRIGMELGAHVGYLNKPDQIRLLHRNRQFNLILRGFWQIHKSANVFIGWNHTSNCAQICFRGREKYRPNTGLDYITVGFIIKK